MGAWTSARCERVRPSALAFGLTVALVVLALRRPGATRTARRVLLVPLGLALLGYAVLPTDGEHDGPSTAPVGGAAG